MTRVFRRRSEWSVFRRVRATELRRVLLRTIYDSNRRYSQRPTVNVNMRYTWAHCGTAWQIQSKLYYAHSSFVTRVLSAATSVHLRRLPVPFAFFSELASLLYRLWKLTTLFHIVTRDTSQIKYCINIMIESDIVEVANDTYPNDTHCYLIAHYMRNILFYFLWRLIM